MKRASIVRNIHKIYTKGDSLGALSFGGILPRSGDLLAVQMGLAAIFKKYHVRGLNYLAILLAAAELERKTGFIKSSIVMPFYSYKIGATYLKRLVLLGLIERAPFPDTFSHIMRKAPVYKLSAKGHDCLRLFRDTFNSYQREVKRAKIKGAENF